MAEKARGACVPLAELAPGARARVCGHGGVSPPRLADLGFVSGTRLRVVRSAPLGDPVEVEIRGYRICLRRRDLGSLCVTPEP